MKAVLVIEDRDTGYVILDRESVPDVTAIGQEIDLTLRGVSLRDVITSSDMDMLWVQTDNPDHTITVEIGRQDDDFTLDKVLDGPDTSYPIPSGEILLDFAEYVRLQGE